MIKFYLDYFELNKREEEARKYFYREIPRYYVWQRQSWKKRKQHFNTLGRVRHVSPNEGDCFYLRILLCHVKGARSFEELYEFDDIKHSNYKEVCLARELIRDDKEWLSAMEEAEMIMTAKQMRTLFARILVHCDPVDPIGLWERFKESLSEDYLNFDAATGFKKAYISLAHSAAEEGRQLKDILKIPAFQNIDLTQNEVIDRDEKMIEANESYALLNDDQKRIINNILAKIGLELPPDSNSGIKKLSYSNQLYI
jgi:ATP-dependent DNA helicase PIF1